MKNVKIKKLSEVGTYSNYETALKVKNSNNDFFKKTEQKNLFAVIEKNTCKVVVYKKF